MSGSFRFFISISLAQPKPDYFFGFSALPPEGEPGTSAPLPVVEPPLTAPPDALGDVDEGGLDGSQPTTRADTPKAISNEQINGVLRIELSNREFQILASIHSTKVETTIL